MRWYLLVQVSVYYYHKNIILKGVGMSKIFELNSLSFKDNLIWGHTKAISYVYIEITDFCNQRCKYCQIDEKNNTTMENSVFEDIINQLSEIGVFEIRLGGGEPLLDKKIIEKVKIVRSHNMSVWICTNGSKLTKGKAMQLKNSGLHGVKISMDSTRPEVHDMLRGKGTWIKALEGINNALFAGLDVTINFTMGEHNIDEYELMEKFASVLGCRLAPHFIMPKGGGKKYFYDSVNQNEFATKHSRITKELLSGDLHCSAMTDMIAIDTYGGVRACLFSEPVESVSNMKIKDILQLPEMGKYMQTVPDNENCERCSYRKLNNSKEKCILNSVCRGGCWFFYEENINN